MLRHVQLQRHSSDALGVASLVHTHAFTSIYFSYLVVGHAGLPLKEGLEGMLAETLFSQMLCLPHSHLKPLAYSALMVRADCA